MHPEIYKNRHYIILVGFAIGVLYLMDILPSTTEIMGLGSMLIWLWGAIILSAALVYYSIYMQPRPRQQYPRHEYTIPRVVATTIPNTQSIDPMQKFEELQRQAKQPKVLNKDTTFGGIEHG